MDQDSILEVAEEARDLIAEETVRTRAGFHQGQRQSCPDPGKNQSEVEEGDLASLKEDYPSLCKYSDNFLRSTPLETLLKLTSTKMKIKEMEKNRAVEDKLTHNRAMLGATKTLVKEGIDNRIDDIHPARFLPGAAISAGKMWLKAREVLGPEGMVPIATYDMGAIGLAGYVTSRGWHEIHNPASTSLTIKLFNINNCGNKTSGLKQAAKAAVSDEEYTGIEDLGELKLAVRAAREAMSYVMPWNKSIAALEGFLLKTDYCKADLQGLERPGLILSQFIDYCLGENTNRWRGQEEFLKAGDLPAVWASYFGGRPQAQMQKLKDAKSNWQANSFRKPGFFGQNNSNFTQLGRGNFFDDICGQWNMGRCLKAPGTCMTSRGVPLRHVCNYRPNLADPTNVCGRDHTRHSFHK
jgi:hypothetical protein